LTEGKILEAKIVDSKSKSQIFRVVLEATGGSKVHYEFDSAFGLLPITASRINSNNHIDESVIYTYKELSRGRWILESAKSESFAGKADLESPLTRITMGLKSAEERPDVNDSNFEPVFSDGTYVSDYVHEKTYIVGEKENEGREAIPKRRRLALLLMSAPIVIWIVYRVIKRRSNQKRSDERAGTQVQGDAIV
jgi:hypothetical protein